MSAQKSESNPGFDMYPVDRLTRKQQPTPNSGELSNSMKQILQDRAFLPFQNSPRSMPLGPQTDAKHLSTPKPDKAGSVNPAPV